MENPLSNEDKARGKGVKKVAFSKADKGKGAERAAANEADFDSDDANHAADIAIAIDDSENTEKSLIQRLARAAARQPKKALLVSFGITILLSALVFGLLYEPKVIPPSGDLTNPDFLAAAGRCGAALQTAGFSFFDLDNYDKWFDDASILYLKETGYYQGPENISEYARFVFSELFEYYYASVLSFVPLPLVADGDTCVISFAVVNSMAVKEEYSSVEGDPSADSIVGFRVSFTITSPDLSTVNISNIHLYYPPGFLQFLFDDVLGGEAVARRTCSILETACSDTFYEKNCYNKVDECVNDVMTLPRTDGDNIDGKTMGCRTLHTEFASVNDKHCPHISFLPEYDANCFLKCQETANNALADAFHPMELGFYKSVAVSAGIGEAEFGSPSIFPPAPEL